jgi:hypothetical protein
MERGSPRRIARGLALLFLALALGEASKEKFVAAGGLLVVALAAAIWGIAMARPTRAPRGQDAMIAHPVRWALVYLVTIGPATFYLTYDGMFHHNVAATVATSLVVAGCVFAVRWLVVRGPRGG